MSQTYTTDKNAERLLSSVTVHPQQQAAGWCVSAVVVGLASAWAQDGEPELSTQELQAQVRIYTVHMATRKTCPHLPWSLLPCADLLVSGPQLREGRAQWGTESRKLQPQGPGPACPVCGVCGQHLAGLLCQWEPPGFLPGRFPNNFIRHFNACTSYKAVMAETAASLS